MGRLKNFWRKLTSSKGTFNAYAISDEPFEYQDEVASIPTFTVTKKPRKTVSKAKKSTKKGKK